MGFSKSSSLTAIGYSVDGGGYVFYNTWSVNGDGEEDVGRSSASWYLTDSRHRLREHNTLMEDKAQ